MLLAIGSAALAPVFAATPADRATEPALGLIVRLKNAPAHAETARAAARAERESRRWDEVLEQAAVGRSSGSRAALRRGIGRDQMLLHFGRPLAAAEAEAMAARLRRHPDVEWVAPNRREQRLQELDATPADPLFAQQWWLHGAGGSDAQRTSDRRRGVPGFLDAWASGIAGATGSNGVVVAVLDTGITTHPELAGRLLPGRDFVSDDLYASDGQPGRDDDPTDPGDAIDPTELADPRLAHCSAAGSSWHGTSVAGLLAAASDNGIGTAGMLRRGAVLPLRVAGKCGATVADIIDAMRWAAGLEVDGQRNPHPARIVNLSFGSTSPCGREYQDTIDELQALGVVVVAAAGNAPGQVTRPANCNGVVGVAALNRDGFKARYSGFGPALAASGIATVGGDDAGGTWGTLLGDGGLVTLGLRGNMAAPVPDYVAVAGTSFAAPLVSGTLALMLAVNPQLDAAQLVAGLRASARPHVASSLLPTCSAHDPGRCVCTTATCGAGILDVRQALVYAQDPGSYVAPAWPVQRVEATEVAQAVALGADTAPVVVPPPPSTDTGGGALGPIWLALLAAALIALRGAPLKVASRRA